MANTTTTSTQFTVNWIDILKGAIMAAITTPITIILESLNAGSFTVDWQHIGTIALAGFLSYIVKNFLSPARIVITDKAVVESVKEGDSEIKVHPK
jgi:hypothetical protein